MFDFQQKNKLRKFFYSPIIVVIFVVLAIYAIYSTWSVYSKMAQSGEDLKKSQEKSLALAAKNNQLDSSISDLQTSEGVEKEIRNKFGVVKPDESIAVIVSDDSATTSTDATHMSLWTKFLNLLGI